MQRAAIGLCVLLLTLGLILPETVRAAADEAVDRTPLEEAAALLISQQLLHHLAAERYDQVLAMLAPEARGDLTSEAVAQAYGQVLLLVGPPTGASDEPTFDRVGKLHRVTRPVHFERGTLDYIVVVDFETRQVHGFFFLNPRPRVEAPPPPYADATRFDDQPMIVTAEFPLTGRLTIPKGDGPHPVVVLVHGSGPGDMNATLGPNQPFRDLAWGLASRGIAVLRYDKRTRSHPQTFADKPFTVDEEVIDDVVAAIDQLRQMQRIDADRVYVLGHSLGGMLGPRIVKRAKGRVAGLIVLAGATRPLPDVIVEQVAHIAKVDEQAAARVETMLPKLKEDLATIQALTDADAQRVDLLLNAPPAYWLDLRSYDPIVVARASAVSMLVMHGGRDYQVTDADFARWQSLAEQRAGITLKRYDNLNHLFMPGEGVSGPAEYMQPNHVDERVIADIARWITREEEG